MKLLFIGEYNLKIDNTIAHVHLTSEYGNHNISLNISKIGMAAATIEDQKPGFIYDLQEEVRKQQEQQFEQMQQGLSLCNHVGAQPQTAFLRSKNFYNSIKKFVVGEIPQDQKFQDVDQGEYMKLISYFDMVLMKEQMAGAYDSDEQYEYEYEDEQEEEQEEESEDEQEEEQEEESEEESEDEQEEEQKIQQEEQNIELKHNRLDFFGGHIECKLIENMLDISFECVFDDHKLSIDVTKIGTAAKIIDEACEGFINLIQRMVREQQEDQFNNVRAGVSQLINREGYQGEGQRFLHTSHFTDILKRFVVGSVPIDPKFMDVPSQDDIFELFQYINGVRHAQNNANNIDLGQILQGAENNDFNDQVTDSEEDEE